MNRCAVALCLALPLACLAGCSSPPRIDLALASQPNINPDHSGRPSPVIVKTFELRTDLNFKQADFQSLFDRPVQVLGADLVAADEMVLIPGEARKVAYSPHPETKYLGVIGGFRQLERSQWRMIIPAAGGQTIPLPRLMTDAQTLWFPLADEEPHAPQGFMPIDEALHTRVAQWLPPSEHGIMQRYVYRLLHERRDLATRVLKRAQAHLPAMLEELQHKKLPLELACLPMVESAFEPGAVSPAGAAGIWQLMPETARRLGLTVNSRVDERFDVHKSTRAATSYLTILYKQFKDWPLALAAYNSGEGAMQKALNQSGCGTLAELAAYCRRVPPAQQVLPEETLQFVPQFTAAMEVMAQSKELGLTLEPLLVLVEQHDTAPPPDHADTGPRLSLSGNYIQDGDSGLRPQQIIKISQSR